MAGKQVAVAAASLVLLTAATLRRNNVRPQFAVFFD
jgi:hypothetical protein